MLSQHPARRGSRVALLTTLAGLGAIAALPAAANADTNGPNSCDASALRLSLLGGAALDPIHANPAATPCVDADGTLINLPSLLGLVDLDAVEATTRRLPNSAAVSDAKIAGLDVGVDGVVDQLTGPLLSGPNSIVGQVDGLVGGLLGPGGALGTSGPLGGLLGNIPLLGGLQLGGINNAGLLTSLTGSLTGALTGALPAVAKADVIEATATARCVSNAPQLSGSSRIVGLQVLGTTIDANGAADQLLSIDTAHLNLGKLLSVEQILRNVKIEATGALALILNPVLGTPTNLWDLLHTSAATQPTLVGALNDLIGTLAPGQNLGTILSGVTSVLQPALNSINVNLPPGLLRAQITPNSQVISGGNLSQNALSLSVSALGQPILDGTLAQAQVGAGAPGCVPPGNPPNNPPAAPKGGGTGGVSPAAAALLQCTKAPLTLIDVGRAGSQTFIYGVARSELIGKQADIYLADGKKKVGSAKVDSDGFFSTKVALPPARIRQTNKARYYAQVDGQKTQALKFSRRMTVSRLTTADGEVTMRGTTTAPRRKNQSAIVIKQRLGCNSYKTLTTVTPDGKGRFSATFKLPAAGDAAVYRAQTQVPRTVRSKKQIGTFTLPRVAGL